MEITLGISTSTPKFEVILSREHSILFNSRNNPDLEESRDMGDLVKTGLRSVNLQPSDIKNIVLDIGPGATSAVRTGVSFANGLSFSLGIPVYPIMSLELMGIQARHDKQVPVLCLIKSMKNNAYIGLFTGDKIVVKYGKLDIVTKLLLTDTAVFSVAGIYEEEIIAMYPEKTIYKSAITKASMDFFIQNQALALGKELLFPNFAQPITEQVLDCYE